MTHTEPNASNYHISAGLGCQVCGCHDASLRLVHYPFNILFYNISIGNGFRGRWCRKHRILYLLLSVFLTATIGWLVFPFCLISNPVALTRLARDRAMHKGNNAKFLRSLGDALLQKGNLMGARQCLEASFQFVEDLWGRQELQNVYSASQSPVTNAGFLRQFLPVFGLLIVAIFLGVLVGAADYYWNYWVSGFQSSGFNVFFGWFMLSALGIPVIFLLRELYDWVDETVHPLNLVTAVVLALLVPGLFLYSILEGRALANLFEVLSNLSESITPTNFQSVLGATLTRGAVLEVFRMANSSESSQFFHTIYVLLLGSYSFFVVLVRAWNAVLWQKKLAEIHARPRPNNAAHGMALAAVVLAVAVCYPVVNQQSFVDFLEARDHYTAGLWLEYEGEFEQALAEFETAARLDPQMSEASEEMAYCYDELGDTEKAIEQALKSININPDSANAHFYLGRLYYFENEDEKAADEFEKAIVLNPDDASAYLGLGWSAYYIGDLAKAEENFQKALELDPELHDAYIGLGTIYDEWEETDKAVEAYEKAMGVDYASSEAYLYLGMAHFHKNDLEQAAETLEKALFFEEYDPLVRIYLAQSYFYQGLLDKAVDLSLQTIELMPEWAVPHAQLAIYYAEMNQLEQANAEIDKAIGVAEEDNTDREFVLQALIRTQRFADAEEEALDAIQNSSDPARFYLYLADVYYYQEKYIEALEACEEAGRGGEDRVDVLLQKADIHFAQDDLDQTGKVLDDVLKIDPDNASAHSLLSSLYYEQEQYSLALDEAQEAIRLDAYFVDAYLNAAFAQLALSDTQGVIRSTAHASKLSPMFDLPHYVLGMAYLETGQNTQALIELNTFLELYQDKPEKREMKEEAEEMLDSLSPTY